MDRGGRCVGAGTLAGAHFHSCVLSVCPDELPDHPAAPAEVLGDGPKPAADATPPRLRPAICWFTWGRFHGLCGAGCRPNFPWAAPMCATIPGGPTTPCASGITAVCVLPMKPLGTGTPTIMPALGPSELPTRPGAAGTGTPMDGKPGNAAGVCEVNGRFVGPINTPGALCCWMAPAPYRDKMESLESCFFATSSDFAACSVNRSRSPDVTADRVAAAGAEDVP